MLKYFRLFIAEFLGTFLIIFTVSTAIIIDIFSGGALGHVGIGIAFGLIVSLMILLFGSISGGHFSPAVSLIMMIFRGLSLKSFLVFVVAQVCGGFLAAYLLFNIFGNLARIGTPSPNLEIALAVDVSPTLLITSFELIFAMIFTAMILTVSSQTKLQGNRASISIGSAIGLFVIIGGPLTGAALNPLRYLATAVISGTAEFMIAYLTAIIAGSLIGGILYSLVVER